MQIQEKIVIVYITGYIFPYYFLFERALEYFLISNSLRSKKDEIRNKNRKFYIELETHHF